MVRVVLEDKVHLRVREILKNKFKCEGKYVSGDRHFIPSWKLN